MNRTQLTPLSNDQLVRLAPSAGATAPHQEVSAKYSFVPTMEAVDMLRSIGWVPVDARECRVRIEGRQGFQKHMIRFLMDGLALSGEERVDLVMNNSHDRGCAFHLSASVWRKVCGNGLMVSSELFNFSHKHIGFDSKAFVASAFKIAEGAGQIGAQVDDMKAIELTPDERGVFAQAAHQLIYPETEAAPIRPEQMLRERRYDDQGKDLWTTYNVIQENIMKGGLHGWKRDGNGRLRRSRTRAVKSIDRDVKLNKALWVLTEEMGRLKRAA